MKKSALLKLSLQVFVASVFAVGCVVYPGRPLATDGAEIDVFDDPPPPVVEEVVAAPGVGFIWVGGAWAWRDRWIWEAGHWDRPPHPGAVWVPHRYVYRNGKHVFIRGGWR